MQTTTKSCQNDILKTLLYYDIFNYPLTLSEIASFSLFSNAEVKFSLDKLIAKKITYQLQGFYSLSNDIQLIKNRIEGNKRAQKIVPKANKISNFIGQFPFVKAVFISGSLSKGYFAKEDDIDYFIITSPNRIWVARTLLIAFKKIFLLNSKKYFCVNYFMSTNALEITHKNRFTATEFATLIPMNGNDVYEQLQNENQWVLDYFPNYNASKKSKPLYNSILKKSLEFLLNGKIGDYLDEKFMFLTKKHQQKKFKKTHKNDFDVTFKGDKNISKHHPDNHQKRVLNKLNEKISLLNSTYSLHIPLELNLNT